jgi:hypothetical protein
MNATEKVDQALTAIEAMYAAYEAGDGCSPSADDLVTESARVIGSIYNHQLYASVADCVFESMCKGADLRTVAAFIVTSLS